MERMLSDRLALAEALGSLILDGAELIATRAQEAYRLRQRKKGGATLRPGRDTPLWNELQKLLRPHLTKHGEQAKLGRLLGLPRQRVNGFVTRKTEMPDAERTLQMLAWLVAVRQGRPPG